MRNPTLLQATILLGILVAASAGNAQEGTRTQWPTATPERQGLSAPALEKAAEYALAHGGGSGCVVRHGHLVKEWGDPEYPADIKSATKGSFGVTCLGLAVDRGLVKLDEKARTYYPEMGAEKPENVATGWLDDITVRHLATMTAGFDDGRPPLLSYRPGTGSIYSNDTSNMLAELLTLVFGEDLREVVRREVLRPIGVADADWRWRDNSFRPKTVGGLPSREFASGIRITYGALARIGQLYLNKGMWNGRRILSEGFIAEATHPTELPAFVAFYAFYWGSNALGTFPEMPKDTYWALGLGDSFVVVCPSLDLVSVRLGAGSNRSRLPGGPDPTEDADWGVRVAGFFEKIVAAVVE